MVKHKERVNMILNRAHILLKDDRQDLRIKENAKVPWQIKYKQREGIAKLRNISVSGMLVETDTSFNPKDECVFSFDSDPEAGIYIPQLGRLVWHKRKRFSRKKYLSGIKFMEADKKVLTLMRSRVEMGVERFVKRRRATTIVGYGLCAVIVAVIGYLVWYSSGIYKDVTAANEKMLSVSSQQAALSEGYLNLFRANEIKLTDATERFDVASQLIQENRVAIALFTEELEATQALLSQTETMLIQANDRNIEMSRTLQTLSAQGGSISPQQTAIADGNIMSVTVAQSLISDYYMKIKSVKGEIKRLKSEDRSARITAIAQIDDQKLQIGNNGYFIKNGQTVQVNERQYNDLKVSRPGAWLAEQNVSIDVTFFE